MLEKKIPPDFILEIAGRVVLTCFYLLMLWNSWVSFLRMYQPGILLYIVLQSLVISFVLLRNPPARLSLLPLDWLVALVPTLMPFLLVPVAGGVVSFIGIVLQYGGAVILIGSVVSLNSSLGIIAADRGIKSGGMYKFIRHPSFLGYMVANCGVLVSNYSLHNFICVASASALQIARSFREERFLSLNSVYATYKIKTRWRFLPYVW